jgi:hypothetical protein
MVISKQPTNDKLTVHGNNAWFPVVDANVQGGPREINKMAIPNRGI